MRDSAPPRLTPSEAASAAAAHERRAIALPPGCPGREDYRAALIARAAILRAIASAPAIGEAR
jgi:hypothetical protein